MINVITPFSRPWNAPILVGHLAKAGVAVTWHPIVGSVAFPYSSMREWVRPLGVKVPAGVNPFCWKLKSFVESGRIVDGERYGVLCDDDLYEDGLLAAVERMSEKIVVVSMLRGDRVPDEADNGFRHPTSTLVAEPENMRPCWMGMQQCFVMGEIFRQANFDPDRAPICDGLVGQWLRERFRDEIRYEPGLHVLFNRLERGRWAVDYEV